MIPRIRCVQDVLYGDISYSGLIRHDRHGTVYPVVYVDGAPSHCPNDCESGHAGLGFSATVGADGDALQVSTCGHREFGEDPRCADGSKVLLWSRAICGR
jgi:hypothetical protein